MSLELSISQGQRSQVVSPHEAAERDTSTETCNVTRALLLARALEQALVDTRAAGLCPAGVHELSLAHSLVSHVVDILADLPPSSTETSSPVGQVEE